MDISKLTSKYQTTIPSDVRRFLKLDRGDAVRFIIEKNHVVIEKASPIDLQYTKFTQATLDEWHSKEDDEAFRDL